MISKSYNELILLDTFEDRFKYLEVHGIVGKETFGIYRYLNQVFYNSKPWLQIRDKVIVRDGACDLGIDGLDIFDKIIIHHINPITITNIENGDYCVFDLNNLICTSSNTHNALHFGGESSLRQLPKIRVKGDTKLW